MAKVSTRKRGNTWYFSFEAALTADGKRKRVEKGGFSSEEQAIAEGIKALASYLRGNIALTSDRVKVSDYLEQWLEAKKSEIRETTYDGYRVYVKALSGVLGHKDLQSVRPMDVNNAVHALANRGYSFRTLCSLLRALKDAFNYAVFPCELIQTNPAEHIKVPRNAPREVIKRVIVRREKLEELLSAYPFGHANHIPFLIAYHTGMRLGEILGLTWDCVDLDRGVIIVARQLVYSSGSGHTFHLPKTNAGRRVIPIDGELVAALRRWKSAQAANELKQGCSYYRTYEAEDGKLWQIMKYANPPETLTHRPLVCTRKDGKVAGRSTLSHITKHYGVNMHSFRHTHATLCAESGAPIKGLAGRLGHSDTHITENLYTHETDRMRADTLKAFERAVYFGQNNSVGNP